MKRLLCIPILVIMLLGCKSNENDSVAAQSAALQSIVGKWLMTESEQIVGGKPVWKPVMNLTPVYITFSPEGIPLDDNGKAGCCGPKELNINGRTFTLDPAVQQTFYNPVCALSTIR
jgi:hypothetical protein